MARRAAKGSTGVTGICGVVILQANNGGASEALLPLYASHNALCLAAACIHLTPHCCMTKAGSPPPGTCQHRSQVEPHALMPCDRQGTTRKWPTIVRLVADQHGMARLHRQKKTIKSGGRSEENPLRPFTTGNLMTTGMFCEFYLCFFSKRKSDCTMLLMLKPHS